MPCKDVSSYVRSYSGVAHVSCICSPEFSLPQWRNALRLRLCLLYRSRWFYRTHHFVCGFGGQRALFLYGFYRFLYYCEINLSLFQTNGVFCFLLVVCSYIHLGGICLFWRTLHIYSLYSVEYLEKKSR